MTFIIRRFSLEYEKLAKKDRPWKVMGSTQLHSTQAEGSKDFKNTLFEMEASRTGENGCYAAVLNYRKQKAKRRVRDKTKRRTEHIETLLTELVQEKCDELTETPAPEPQDDVVISGRGSFSNLTRRSSLIMTQDSSETGLK